MIYRSLKMGALAMLVILFFVLSNAVRQDVQPVMADEKVYISVEALAKSIGMINTIEYKQHIKTSGSSKNAIEIHYYYRRPGYLRIDTQSSGNQSIDIYNPSGMYEYFPKSSTAYYREKWKDDQPISFQLEDKLQDIKVSGKYEHLRMESVSGINCEVVRSVDEEGGSIYEHRIWFGLINNLQLPVREEYLTDGEMVMFCEYEYISVNREIPNSLFELKDSDDLKIFNVGGIPKTVRDEKEAEKYVKFDVIIPKSIPDNLIMTEICVIPPVKKPTVMITYLSDMNTIYLSEKKEDDDELEAQEKDKIIKAGGKKFIVRRLFNDSISIKWARNDIEFDVSGPYTLKDEIIKIVQGVSGQKLTLE